MNDRVERVFAGWDRPLLHSVRDLLLARSAASEAPRLGAARDLSSFTVVLPGARAGRRLVELLTMEAGVIIPPSVLTLGSWIALGTVAGGVEAGELARHAAWVNVMRDLPLHQRSAIARTREDDSDSATVARWMNVARLVDACHVELCGAGYRFADVARVGLRVPDFPDADRWSALASAQQRFQQVLRENGRIDVHLDRLERVEREEIDHAALSGRPENGHGVVVLAGITEMSAVIRRIVASVSDRCVALISAPDSFADRFDELGCIVPGAWEHAKLDMAAQSVIVAEGPEGQALAALRVVERLRDEAGASIGADQITIGVPDAEVEDRLRRVSGRLGTVPVRRAEGTAVSFTRPIKLLLGIAEYVERRDFPAMAALLRHPDVERWIRKLCDDSVIRTGRWLRLLDEYQAEHLHGVVDGRWLTEQEDVLNALTALDRSLNELLGGRDAAGSLLTSNRLGVSAWTVPIWNVIRALYEGAERTPQDAATVEACDVIRSVLSELHELPAALANTLRLSASETIRLIVLQAGGESIPDSSEGPAIDLVGWLELATDDAPWMIVTGMNEGSAPAATGVDPLLTDSLRRALRIRDRQSRLARDIYAATVMYRARPEGRTVFIFGRRSESGDPLAPSRLLLIGDDASLLTRVRQWTGAESTGLDDAMVMSTSRVSAFDTLPFVLSHDSAPREIDEMSVTSFADYLCSPYGFYLKHIMRLREVDDTLVEMDALGFGTLMHEVVRKLSDAEMCGSTDADRIGAFLTANLDSAAALVFGPDPRAEVWVQLEQARLRLRAFARIQADWAADGWRVARTEWEPPARSAFLVVDDKPMYLRGRIDRIDVNEQTGEWAVLDYKTSTRKPEPRQALNKAGRWLNPQLPLYRHLARGLAQELGLNGEPRLGWIAMPADTAETGIIDTKWTSSQLALADETAADVVRSVRQWKFAELGDAPPGFGILGALCGGLEHEETGA